jgi:hypothetical protein
MKKTPTITQPPVEIELPKFDPCAIHVNACWSGLGFENALDVIEDAAFGARLDPAGLDFVGFYFYAGARGALCDVYTTAVNWERGLDDDGHQAVGSYYGNELTCLYVTAYTLGRDEYEKYMESDGGDAIDCMPHPVDRDALVNAGRAAAYFAVCRLLTSLNVHGSVPTVFYDTDVDDFLTAANVARIAA